MKHPMIALLLLFTCLLPVAGHSQEMKKSPTGTDTAATETRNRLPNNYGKIGLSDEQRDRIYRIQADYRVRISELLDELEELRNQQTLEIQEVLTSGQKEELQAILKTARERRATRKSSSASKS